MKFMCNKYKNLGFYVKGEIKHFNDGEYSTKDKEEIEILSNMADVEAEKKGDK